MSHSDHIHYYLHKGPKTGEYIGQCVELPGVIFHAPTEEGLQVKLNEALEAYYEAFPEEHDKLPKVENKMKMEMVEVRHN
jgi:predicted RNase H-like HicB family nuclease